MDVHSKEKRSYNMSRIKGKDTKPEIILRKWLWANGYRYRLHGKYLPGKPDVVFSGRKKVIFVHGCFWHKHDCSYFRWPSTNKSFWRKKILETVRRDNSNYDKLTALGWSYLTIWECHLRVNREAILNKVGAFIDRKDPYPHLVKRSL